jgi:predicted O-methyltransferase YrrM
MELMRSRDIAALDPVEVASQLQSLGFTHVQVADLIRRLHGPSPSLREHTGLGQHGEVHPFLLTNRHANVSWLALAAPLFSPQMGVENMSPLLYSLVRFFKPARVLEVGAGFTSLFILQALADNAAEVRQYQRLAMEQHQHQQELQHGKNISASACFLPDGTTPWCVEGWLEKERQRQRHMRTMLHSVDKLASASRVRQIAQAMGTDQHLRLHVADIFEPMFDSKLDEGLGGAGPLDMIWLDFGSGEDLPDVTGRLWRRLRPGGLLLVSNSTFSFVRFQKLRRYLG